MSEHGFAEIEGGRLRYAVDGDGPALLLLSGGMLDIRLWEPQIEPLSRIATVIRCDLRGYGRSTLPSSTEYRHCDDVRTLLEHLGIDEACVGGQSLGGTVALDVALAHPELVRGLVLAPALPVLGWRWVEGFPVAPALQLARTDGVDAAKAAFLDLPLNATAMSLPGVAASLRAMVADYSGWHLTHRDPGVFEAPDAIDRLGEVLAPALVITGAADVFDSVLVARRLAEELPDCELHLLDEVGHCPNLEAPLVVNELIAAFLDRLP